MAEFAADGRRRDSAEVAVLEITTRGVVPEPRAVTLPGHACETIGRCLLHEHPADGTSADGESGRRVVICGVLEVRSAHDGQVDVAIAAAGFASRVNVDYGPGFTPVVRDNILADVTAAGTLHRSAGSWVLRLAWLEPTRRD